MVQTLSAVKPLQLAWLQKFREKILRNKLDPELLPKHVGMILDGNRRYAKSLGIPIKTGHAMGIQKFHSVLEWCYELAIKHLTIWVFSSENWKRDSKEVHDLQELFAQEAERLIRTGELVKHSICVKVIGDISGFTTRLRTLLKKLENQTKDGVKMFLNIAIGYGGRQEIVESVKSFLDNNQKLTGKDLAKKINERVIDSHSYLRGQPSPDLILRTSGELRHSGFLLWHSPYSEYFYLPIFWPAIQRIHLLRAFISYQKRQRRYGA